MKSWAWVKGKTIPVKRGGKSVTPPIEEAESKYIWFLSHQASKGIWRPDSLPYDAEARIEFFEKFSEVSLKTLGLQLSEDTVAKVNGRIARSFNDAVRNLAGSIARLRNEFRGLAPEPDEVH